MFRYFKIIHKLYGAQVLHVANEIDNHSVSIKYINTTDSIAFIIDISNISTSMNTSTQSTCVQYSQLGFTTTFKPSTLSPDSTNSAVTQKKVCWVITILMLKKNTNLSSKKNPDASKLAKKLKDI